MNFFALRSLALFLFAPAGLCFHIKTSWDRVHARRLAVVETDDTSCPFSVVQSCDTGGRLSNDGLIA